MASKVSRRRTHRVTVYQVTYVVSCNRRDGSGRRRRWRDGWFGGMSARQAAGRAAAWGREIAYLDLEWEFGGVKILAVTRLFTMARCSRCRAFPGPADTGILCLCSGLVCQRCGRRNIWRPISEYYDEAQGTFWHVPHFQAMRLLCDACAGGAGKDHALRSNGTMRWC